MTKYYAVRHGRVCGIFRTWDECKKNVHRFPKAQYKSFKFEKDALEYLGGGSEGIKFTFEKANRILNLVKKKYIYRKDDDCKNGTSLISKLSQNPSKTPQELHIYTDGSHIKPDGAIGYGAWCQYENKNYSLSGKIDDDFLLSYNIINKVSNPTAEFIAFHQVLTKLEKIKTKVLVTFYIDYVGVIKWMSGAWKAKQPHIQKVKNKCDQILKNTIHSIKYVHVPAHSGVYGNVMADKLAKSQEDINTFD